MNPEQSNPAEGVEPPNVYLIPKYFFARAITLADESLLVCVIDEELFELVPAVFVVVEPDTFNFCPTKINVEFKPFNCINFA